LFKQRKNGHLQSKIQSGSVLIFGLFPGGLVPDDLRKVGSIFEASSHIKNSF
jgi:hypothetical protein